jgi:PAS domain S-box-containing protein
VPLSVSRKGLLLATVPLVFQLAFVVAVVGFQTSHAEAEFWARHSTTVIAEANEIRSTVADAEAAARGYVISRLPRFAENFRAASGSLPAQFESLNRLVADNSTQAERARSVRRAADAVVEWQRGLESLAAGGAGEQAAARVGAGRGEELGRAFRQELAVFLAEEERLVRDRANALDRSRLRLNVLVVLGGAAAIAGTLALAVVFRRRITRRFVALESTARLLAEGRPPPAPLDGTDEIARLDRAFRDMATALTRTAADLRDLYDNAPCGYHSVGPDGIVAAVNRTELRWLGYDYAEVVGRMRFADIVAPVSRAAYLDGFARVREYGTVTDVELELVRKDGTTFPVLVGSTSVRDTDGRYLRSRTTLTDLTERKRAEAAVRTFADVARNIPIGLLVYQLDATSDPPILRFRSGNPGASQLLNVPLDAAAGRPVPEVFPAIPPDQLRRYTAVAEGGGADDLGEFRYGDDRVTERWWAVQAFALPERSVGIAFQDVTDRRQAQDEVRRLNAELEGRVRERTAALKAAETAAVEAAARLRAIVETAVDGIITIGERGVVETVNPAAERMFGYAAAELTGRNIRTLMPEPFHGEHDGYLARYLETGDRKVIGVGREVRGQRKDGSVFPLDLAVSETLLDGRRLFTGLVRDITARKRAEDDLRRAVDDLEAANRDLVEKNAENEMFVYSVSHDLRSPLVNLQGFSKELEKSCQHLARILAEDGVPTDVGERCRGLLDGKMAKSVGFIQSAVLRLSGIIDALLRLSRAGRVEYRWETVEVGEVVRQVVAAAQGTVAEKGATVRIGDLRAAWGDRTAVEQVFANLVGNALTYLDPTRPGVIEVGTLPPVGSPDFRTYFVRDNGLGIAPGHRHKIFQAFQRAHPDVGRGEGLGLAIVARVVERHRGRVWVESAPGEGSTFFVTLPTPREAGR